MTVDSTPFFHAMFCLYIDVLSALFVALFALYILGYSAFSCKNVNKYLYLYHAENTAVCCMLIGSDAAAAR